MFRFKVKRKKMITILLLVLLSSFYSSLLPNEKALANASAQFTLTIFSSHGIPTPSVGSHSYSSGSSINCGSPSSITENGVTYVCTGWSGTGSVKASGSGSWTTFSITQDSSITWNWQTVSSSGDLLNLPAPSYDINLNLTDRARLTISSNQIINVSPMQTFSIDYGYKIWQGSNPSEIDQMMFVCSWTPTWPPSSAYYQGIYNSIPPSAPGDSGSGTASFTAPSTPGTYYIWVCFEANYGYSQAANSFNIPLNGLPAQFKVIVGSSSSPTQTGLVGYWAFDEASGNIVHDSSGNSNDGAIHDATWTDGMSGNALHFNGVDSWVEIPNSPSLSGLSQITLEAWIKGESIPSRPTGIISKCDGSAPPTNAEYFLGLNDDGRVFFETDNGVAIFSSQSDRLITQTGVWYHVAATWSGNSYSMFVNGQQVYSGTCSPQTTLSNTLPVQIGRHGSWSWVYFDGLIDEVKIYNYARTSNEIANDYTLGSRTFDPVADTFSFRNTGYGDFVDNQLGLCLVEHPLTFSQVADTINSDPVYNTLEAALPGVKSLLIPMAYFYLSDNQSTLSGHCFGISKLEVDWYNNPSSKPSGTDTVRSLKMNDGLHQLIDTAQQSQVLDFYTYSRLILMETNGYTWSNLNEYQLIKNTVQRGSPVIMGLYDKSHVFSTDSKPFVHVVVVYKIESSSTIDTVYIADPNKIIQTLQFDTSKTDLGLSYRVAAEGITDKTILNAFINYLSSGLAFWIQCPVTMQITDESGQSVGWAATGNKLENFNALLYQANDNQLVVVPQATGSYKVELLGTGTGDYNLTMFRTSEMQIIVESKVSSIASEQRIAYTVNVDNGTLENAANSSPWIYITVFIIGGIVAIIIIATFVRRKRKIRGFDFPPPPPQP